MGRRIEIYLWMGVAAGFVVAAVGRRSWLGYTGWAIVGVCIALWVAYLLLTSDLSWRKKPKKPVVSPEELGARLRAARAGGPLLSPEDQEALLDNASGLDDAVLDEAIEALPRSTGALHRVDLGLATASLRWRLSALDALLRVLPALAAEDAARIASDIVRDAGRLARATPIVLAETSLTHAFAKALADAFGADPALRPPHPPGAALVQALSASLSGDPARRAVLDQRIPNGR